MNRFKKHLLVLPLILGALVLSPLGSSAQVPPEDVPESLEAAIKAEVESRDQMYAGLCNDIEQSDHVGEWCATVLSLSDSEATVGIGAVASDEVEQVTFTMSGDDWEVETDSETPTPATSTPESTGTPSQPTATPGSGNDIQAPSTGDGGLR